MVMIDDRPNTTENKVWPGLHITELSTTGTSDRQLRQCRPRALRHDPGRNGTIFRASKSRRRRRLGRILKGHPAGVSGLALQVPHLRMQSGCVNPVRGLRERHRFKELSIERDEFRVIFPEEQHIPTGVLEEPDFGTARA